MLEALNLKNNAETRYRCQESVYRTTGPLVLRILYKQCFEQLPVMFSSVPRVGNLMQVDVTGFVDTGKDWRLLLPGSCVLLLTITQTRPYNILHYVTAIKTIVFR